MSSSPLGETARSQARPPGPSLKVSRAKLASSMLSRKDRGIEGAKAPHPPRLPLTGSPKASRELGVQTKCRMQSMMSMMTFLRGSSRR